MFWFYRLVKFNILYAKTKADMGGNYILNGVFIYLPF